MTETLELTYEQALQGLKDAVANKGPDFQYSDPENPISCKNFTESGQPSCIAGHAYYTYKPEWARDDKLMFTPVGTLVDEGNLDVDMKTQVLLMIAQNKQDRGVRWGKAVETAQKVAERFGHLL